MSGVSRWSDPVEPGRSLDDMVADLHAVLKNGKVPSPYVLVGHSMGGLLVRRFARAYPDLVAGVVLVDSPDELVVFRDDIRPFYAQGMRMQRVLGIFARLGLLRLLGRRIPMLMLPDDPVGYALCATPKHARAAADDMQAMFNASEAMKQQDSPGALGNRPLLLLEHGIPFPPMAAAMEEGWSDSQRRLTHLSTNSEFLTAHKCGHLIYVDDPELVIESVRRVHAAARNGTQLTSAVPPTYCGLIQAPIELRLGLSNSRLHLGNLVCTVAFLESLVKAGSHGQGVAVAKGEVPSHWERSCWAISAAHLRVE